MSDTELGDINGRASPTPGGRHEKSLGLLTSKFVHLLQNAEGGVLDLKKAADMLDVKQKRRIYDITNVLEGIGLIEKETKNTIKWKGASHSSNSDDILERLDELRSRKVNLEMEEKELEKQCQRMHQCFRYITEDTNNDQLSFVTREDVKALSPFKDDTVLAIQAPQGTELHAQTVGEKYQMYLKSSAEPIRVLVLNRENSTYKTSPFLHSSPGTSVRISPSDTKHTAQPTCDQSQSPEKTPMRETLSTSRRRSKRLRSDVLVTKLPSSPQTDTVTPMDINTETPIKMGYVSTSRLLIPIESLSSASAISATGSGCLEAMDTSQGVPQNDDSGESLLQAHVPVLSLSPAPNDTDYFYHLDDREGLLDLYDISQNTSSLAGQATLSLN